MLLIYYYKPYCVKNKTWKSLEERNKINNFSLFYYTHCFCKFLPRDIHSQTHTAVSYFSCASLHWYKSTLNPTLEIKGQKEHLIWSTAQAREQLTRHLQWGSKPLHWNNQVAGSPTGQFETYLKAVPTYGSGKDWADIIFRWKLHLWFPFQHYWLDLATAQWRSLEIRMRWTEKEEMNKEEINSTSFWRVTEKTLPLNINFWSNR